MLTPQQVIALRERAGQVTDPIVEYLISDIAERVAEAGQLSSTAAYQAWTAQRLGVSQKELKKELKKRLNLSAGEINQLFEQAAQTGYANDIARLGESGAVSFDENLSLQQILDAAVKQAQDDFTNLTQTIGFVGPDGVALELTDAYQRACDFAFEKVALGAQDYNSAIRDATRGLMEKGILALDYASGVHTSLEAAVRRNMMGGLGIMVEQITQQNHDMLGCDGWEISAHMGSAPDHEPIQGKQYSDEEYTRLNNSLVRRIGTLNCGHSAMPVILGVNDPQYTNEELEEFRQQNEEGVTYEGKHYTLYEATQRQRKLERSIRKRKHRILIDEHLGDKDTLQTDQIRLQLLKQEYGRFSKAAGLPMQYERMEAAGFTWKHGKAAEKEALMQRNSQVSAAKGGRKRSASVNDTRLSVKREQNSSIGVESWNKDKRKVIYSTEFGTKGKAFEVSYLYDSEGKRIFKKNGDSGGVIFTEAEIKQMRNGVLTHNHPNGSCFSPEDINMLRRGRLLEVRAVTPQGVYMLRKPNKWNKDISNLEKIDAMYYNIDAEVSPAIYARAAHGDITYAQADILSQETVIQEFAKRYGLEFDLISWDDIRREIN